MTLKRKGISTASRKNKGRKFQQQIKASILEACPSLEPEDIVSTSMGAGGEDLKLSPKARKEFPYSVECKAVKAATSYNWYEQAKTNCPKGAEPIAIFKVDRKEPLVIISLDHFLNLTTKDKKERL